MFKNLQNTLVTNIRADFGRLISVGLTVTFSLTVYFSDSPHELVKLDFSYIFPTLKIDAKMDIIHHKIAKIITFL